jgi:predicted aconitase
MAQRQMRAYEQMGCRPTWTCAPYQAGHRPAIGEHVAWGESNAVAFVNSVLGARTDRYGDFLDICCAITGKAPLRGLHLSHNRLATVVVDVRSLPQDLLESDVLFPVLGAWLGSEIGSAVAVFEGIPPTTSEDRLKALGASAASTGAVGLFHVAGVTPEAPDLATALGGREAAATIVLTPEMVAVARNGLSTSRTDELDVVALGSPHFSLAEFGSLERLLRGRRMRTPCYVCTGRGVLRVLEDQGRVESLRQSGVVFVVDTCVVVTPILPDTSGVLMTNSGKFAHYSLPNTGYDVVYGSLADCVESGVEGRVVRDERMWSSD